MDRRKFIKYGAGLALVPPATWWSTPCMAAAARPTWLSFGLNGPAQGSSHFPLTMAMSQHPGSKGGNFQLQVSQAISRELRKEGDFVDFRDSADINDGVLLGAALDYENVLSARLGDSSFIVLHLVGHGMLLNFDRSRGWKMLSSFPFPVTLLRKSEGGKLKTEASQYLLEAYTDSNGSFATAFAKAAKRLAPGWKDNDKGFNVRVMSSRIHPDVQAKLKEWGIAGNISEVWLGHLASAAACDGLGVPVVPFVETQALGKFTYKFSEQLVAQNVRLPDEQDIDLRLHITLRNMVREVKYRKQLERWEVTRIVVLDIKALDDRDQPVVSLRMGYSDDQPDVVTREEDVVPARDAHFFDMAIYRGLQALFSAIDRQDGAGLEKLFVKPDAAQQKGLDKFRSQYRKAV